MKGIIIGIDLGTTYSAAATIDKTGRPVMVPNSLDGGDYSLIESVVQIQEDGTAEVGAMPYNNFGLDPSTFGRFKREMENPDFKYRSEYGKTYTPTMLSGFVLQKIKKYVEHQIGQISECIITVPANFEDIGRSNTLKAAEQAGLKVKNIINEPTAAALFYAYENKKSLNGKYAIYDLGGGTFDISIIQAKGGKLEVLGYGGIKKCGGDDFDDKIFELTSGKFREKNDADLEIEDFRPKDCESYKKELSVKEKVKVMLRTHNGKLNSTTTRKVFEDRISEFITQTEMACENCFEDAGLTFKDVEEVVLVGGSTRMPYVRRSVEKMFGKKPKSVKNPDQAVALGAALYGALKNPEKLTKAQKKETEGFELQEIVSKYFGTRAMCEDEETGVDVLRNIILLKKGTPLPCSHTESLFTRFNGQEAINCTVTEGDLETNDIDFVRIAWEGVLELPPGRPAGMEMKVTFGYDENQVMNCSFVDVETGNSKEVDLHKDDFVDDEEDFFTEED